MAVLLLLAFDSVNGQVVKIVSDAGTYTVEHGFFQFLFYLIRELGNVSKIDALCMGLLKNGKKIKNLLTMELVIDSIRNVYFI